MGVFGFVGFHVDGDVHRAFQRYEAAFRCIGDAGGCGEHAGEGQEVRRRSQTARHSAERGENNAVNCVPQAGDEACCRRLEKQ